MRTKDQRFEIRATRQELDALDQLVRINQLPARAAWITEQIKREAERHKVWSGAKNPHSGV